MKLYTYSRVNASEIPPVVFDTSKNRWEAQIMMAEARRGWRNRFTTIPFFHDRLPIQLVRDLFGKTNPYWPYGVGFFEYVVDTAFFKDFFYYVIDPPELADFEPGAPGTGTSFPEMWFKTMHDYSYLGTTKEELKEAVSHLVAQGPMRKQIEALPNRQSFETIKDMINLGLPMIFFQSKSKPLSNLIPELV